MTSTDDRRDDDAARPRCPVFDTWLVGATEGW
ncbi:hypothetical protein JO380_003205 [Cellulomonas iranensis]|uniref:Uncharacterized protein n=1 Tax=Cellulomonas iranensis TaxID=76862 RepID=A0ABU0GN79_9CELL|nr:hypothetical protein [Cellulomonas iranensis]